MKTPTNNRNFTVKSHSLRAELRELAQQWSSELASSVRMCSLQVATLRMPKESFEIPNAIPARSYLFRLLRPSSLVRAVCENALVRICAGVISDGRPYRSSDSANRRPERCVEIQNGINTGMPYPRDLTDEQWKNPRSADIPKQGDDWMAEADPGKGADPS